MTTDTTDTTAKPYIAALRAGDLFADSAYKRDLDLARVERMSDEFDHTLLGVLEVSARCDGRYAIIDGQHRWGVVRNRCGEDEHLVCQVHTGLSPADEARLFLEIDTGRRNLTWWDRWRARRGKGDPNVLAIDEILNRHGLQVNPAPADGHIRATKSLETIVDDLGDLQMLDSVLIVLTAAFGIGFDTFDGGLMQGVALVLGHYDADELETDRLVAQLRTVSPRQLRAKAVALREAHRGTVPRLCAAVVVECYNAGRGRHVEDFFTRVPSVSKTGTGFNRTRKNRAAIRRWAEGRGYDIGNARNIPPSIRQAYEKLRSMRRRRARRAGIAPPWASRTAAAVVTWTTRSMPASRRVRKMTMPGAATSMRTAAPRLAFPTATACCARWPTARACDGSWTPTAWTTPPPRRCAMRAGIMSRLEQTAPAQRGPAATTTVEAANEVQSIALLQPEQAAQRRGI